MSQLSEGMKDIHRRVYIRTLIASSSSSSSSCPVFSSGETIFYRGDSIVASVAPKPGMALVHQHGDECLEHEGGDVEGTYGQTEARSAMRR